MKSIVAAIGRALAAMAALIVVWCKELGRFVLRCMPGYVPPDPADVVEMYDDAGQAVNVTPKADAQIAGLQAVADALFRGQVPDASALEGLSPKAIGWLELLDADMLLSVARAKPEHLQSHLNGKATIGGLLRYEDDAIAAYRDAIESKGAESEIEYRRRRPRKDTQLPAFGPMC